MPVGKFIKRANKNKLSLPDNAALILTDQDRQPDGNLTPSATLKIFAYWDEYFTGRCNVNVTALARATGINWRTAKQLLIDYGEHRRERIVNSQFLKNCLMENYLSDFLEDIHANRLIFHSDAEKIKCILLLTAEINACKDAILPPQNNAKSMETFTMGERLTNYLLEKLKTNSAALG